MFEPYQNGAGIIRYRVWPGEPVDEFALSMLQQNTPEHVLLLGRETTEEGDWLLLPVAGLVPLSSDGFILINKFTGDKFLEALETTLNSLQTYMIPPETLVLRPEWTWVRPETGEPVFLVLPTPSARDLSLSRDDYVALVTRLPDQNQGAIDEANAKSAKKSANPRPPAKPWRRVLRDYWENLD